MPRTLHLHWPGLVSDAAAPHLRSAQHALGRISPLVHWSSTRIEIGIDGLQARNGDERGVLQAALRSVRTHLRSAPLCAIASSRLAAAAAAQDEACRVLLPGEEREYLAEQPIETLLLAATSRSNEELAAAVERCRLLGVRTLGGLARLRSGELAARLGAVASLLIPLARGEDVQPILPLPLPRRLVAREPFDQPLTSIEELRFPLRRALEEIRQKVQPRTMQAFELYGIKGMPVEAVERETGMSAAAIRHAKMRILHDLQECVRRYRQQEG